RRFAERFAPDALRIEGTTLGVANVDIEHVVHLVRARDQYAALVNTLLLVQGARCLVFVRRRTDAAEVAEQLAGDGFSTLPLSGDLPQAQRTRTLSAFRNGIVRTLIATDVAARGIDVADIDTVVHVDLPRDATTYTHRAGRTGRAGNKGRSVLLAAPRDERHVQRVLERARVDAEWTELPSAAKIKKALSKRARRRVHEAMSDE
ncbi:MAG: C-terminal helicase domain-containing protein, partial [Ilumatobacter sp.]|nr:C-terminal helicase domain-containing protein [Ilumatobacter sp.]